MKPRISILLLLLALVLSACARGEVPFQPNQIIRMTATQSRAETLVARVTPQHTPDPSTPKSYSVVWLPAGASLTVHHPAGIAGTIIDQLGQDQAGIELTENRTMLGTSEWVEILLPGGGKGWVNAWNLTEEVAADEFCGDPRIRVLISQFREALINNDAGSMARLVSPKRGLTIRHDWWNPEVTVPMEDLAYLFANVHEYDWGIQVGSRRSLEGTFREVILPRLEDVFSFPTETACDRLVIGITSMDVRWPTEYTNLNYYSVHRPAPIPGNGFNWRTWALGFEYVESQPYIAVLVQYWAEF